jgi:hypothetical protein
MVWTLETISHANMSRCHAKRFSITICDASKISEMLMLQIRYWFQDTLFCQELTNWIT